MIKLLLTLCLLITSSAAFSKPCLDVVDEEKAKREHAGEIFLGVDDSRAGAAIFAWDNYKTAKRWLLLFVHPQAILEAGSRPEDYGWVNTGKCEAPSGEELLMYQIYVDVPSDRR